MALTQCPDCGKQVSDSAPSCPGCGRPMTATTVEQTGKPYKAWQVIGVLLFIAGLVIWIGGGSTVWGVSILVGGTVVYVASRAGAWWNHG